MKVTKERFAELRDRVLRGIRHFRHSADGDAAYKEAESEMSPHQLGALHRLMYECEAECHYNDMMMLSF